MLSISQKKILCARHASPLLLPLAGMLALTFGAPARAAISDTIQPFVSVGYGYDDNLFRLPDETVGGPVSDRNKSVIAGFAFERPVSRQVFSGSLKVSKVSFDRYSQLDYNGKDGSLLWRWVVGNNFDGTIGATYEQTLNSFADFHGTERNLRVRRGEYIDGGWRFSPHWRVRGRASHDEFTYDLPTQRYLNRKDNAGEVGIDYVASTRSSIGLQARQVRGSYTDPLIFGSLRYDQDYKQNDLKLKLVWNYDEIAQLQFLGGKAKREHTLLTERDATGTNARLSAVWKVRPAVRLTAVAAREFAPYEGGTFTYSLNQTRSLHAEWNLSAKVTAEADTRSIKRDFTGAAARGVPDVSDSGKTHTLSLNYAALRNVQLSASVFRDTRDGARGLTQSYRAKGASINASIQF